jgi:hypothetical protein
VLSQIEFVLNRIARAGGKRHCASDGRDGQELWGQRLQATGPQPRLRQFAATMRTLRRIIRNRHADLSDSGRAGCGAVRNDVSRKSAAMMSGKFELKSKNYNE